MLEVDGICKDYDGQPLLKGVSFHIAQDETICLLGPSGSGKSTLLLIIAGLEMPEFGKVLWDGEDLASTPAHLRDFGLVFQDYALFPHLDVFENVAFGLRMQHWPAEKTRARVSEVLDIVSLAGFEHRGVTQLSGGEQQRVALARALAPGPRLLMFDEPLGALDRALREELLAQLRRILKGTAIPALYVTHDQDEAAAIADRVLLLHDGRIIREGSVSEVWSRPGSEWAAEFLGLGNVIEGKVLDGRTRVATAYGTFAASFVHRHKVGDTVKLLVRPDPADGGATIRGRVADVVFQQGRYRITLERGLFFFRDAAPKVGANISVKVKAECLE